MPIKSLVLLLGLVGVAYSAETVEDLQKALDPVPANTQVRIDGKPVKLTHEGDTLVLSGESVSPVPPVPPPAPSRKLIAGPGLMQGGERNNSLTDAQFANPKLKFFTLRDRWNLQEKTNDVFNFSYNNGQIKRCEKVNKPFVLGNMTGASCTPDHVPGQRITIQEKNGPQTLLLPWSPAIPIEYGKFLHAQSNSIVGNTGVKLKDHPLLSLVWITGPTISSQEMHSNPVRNLINATTEKAWVDNWNKCIDLTKQNYPNVPGVLSLSGQPGFQKGQAQVVAHFKKVYGKDAHFQHNSLGTQTTLSALHHQLVLQQAKEGYRIGFEQVQPGHVSALSKAPEANFNVLYPRDEAGLK
jgi:hypothetical protein